MQEFFEPKSVAVIGASNDITKWGGSILQNLINSGYDGKIFPINIKESEIQNLPSYHSILDVPQCIDCAIITIPIKFFNDVLEECGKKGVKGIIAITAGFKESGNEIEEKKAVKICKKYGMRMIGPNMMGIISKNFNASFMLMPKMGHTSFIAQSGTMCISLVDRAIHSSLGLSKVISLGNQSEVDIIDLLEYLDKDESTKIIVIYIEGINRGQKFIEVCKNIKKPIIILKSGRSSKGAKAAFSHTGSMAGSDDIYSIAFKQAGCIRIKEIDELFDAALVFSNPLPKGNRIGIITNGGGAGILAADACEKFDINIRDISEETKIEIKKYLTMFGTAGNPTDTAAQSSYDVYKGCIDVMLKDNNIDALICIYVHASIADIVGSTQALIDAKKETDKPIIACWFGGEGIEKGIKILEDNNIPNYDTPEKAVRALSYLVQQKIFLEKKNEAK